MSIIEQCKLLATEATSPDVGRDDQVSAAMALAMRLPKLLDELAMIGEQSRSDVHRAFTEFRKRAERQRSAAGERERKLSQANDPNARFFSGIDSGLGNAITMSFEIGEEWPLVKVDEGGE